MRKAPTLQRAALLLALTLVFQSLRLFIPIPPPASMFFIGSLVNGCLVLGILAIDYRAALLIAFITPFVAYMQGQLPFFLFIFPVATGNICFVTALYLLRHRADGIRLVIGIFVKTVILYGTFSLLFRLVNFPVSVQTAFLFAMSWPQLVTALLGGILAFKVYKRIKILL